MYTSKLFESYNKGLNESEELTEKINKDNIEINKAIANPNAGKNRDKIKAAGYNTREDSDGKVYSITNPKTNNSVNPSTYTRDEKGKIDFKGKLDSDRPYKGKVYVDKRFGGKGKMIPNRAIVGKNHYGDKIANTDDYEYYSSHSSLWDNKPNYTSISKNIRDYKDAVETRDDSTKSAERGKDRINYYVDKVKQAQDDLDRENQWIKDKEKQASDAEEKRKSIIDNIRKRKIESEEFNESEEFKVGDIVKVPYKYGVYTPGEFIDAPIIDIEDGQFITVEIPSKLVLTADQLRKYNKGIDESENLNEEYSEKLGGDPEDFVSDVQSILDTLNTIDTSKFGSHLAEEIVEEFIETCNYQIERGKRLASGKEFYTEAEKLEEKRNPENDEANELIRNSLNNDEYAKNHTTELRKHGIKYIPPEKGQEWRGGALEGKEGRRLKTMTNDDYYKDRADKVTSVDYDSAYSKGYSHNDSYSDQADLHQKTYKDSKERYKNARDNIKKQEAKVKRMEDKDKEVGLKWNEKTYNAQQKLKGYQNTIEKGIQGDYKSSDKIHPDTDLKGFLNAKKHSDRPLPREKDPKFKRDSRIRGRGIADPANKDVETYKEIKSGKDYISREKERNAQQDKEDQERINYYKQRAKEDKARRDEYIKKNEKETNKLDSKLQKKLDKFRKRMTNK